MNEDLRFLLVFIAYFIFAVIVGATAGVMYERGNCKEATEATCPKYKKTLNPKYNYIIKGTT